MTSSSKGNKSPKKQLTPYPLLPKTDGFFKRSVGSTPSIIASPVRYRRIIHSTRHTTSGVFVNDTTTDVSTGWSNSRSFARNKDWKQQVAKRQDATYAYTRTGFVVEPCTWYGTSTSNNFGNPETDDDWGQHLGAFLIDDSSDAALKDIALARLKNKLSSNIGSHATLPPLAESKEIHKMVRGLNDFMEDVMAALYAIKETRGKAVPKIAGKIWLYFNFGVNPLIDDLTKAADAIRSYQERTDHVQPISGSASKDYRSQGITDLGLITGTGVQMKIISSANHRLSYRFKGSVAVKIRSDASYSVMDHLGLTWSQLPSAAWELTPYSWVVDYFTTVGPWLDDMFYTLPGVLVYLSLNRRYEQECTHSPQLTYGGTTRCYISTKPGKSRYFSFSREKLAILPSRQLRVKSFDEVAKNGLSKVMNLASVLAGHLKFT
jgi:hypothetical protein